MAVAWTEHHPGQRRLGVDRCTRADGDHPGRWCGESLGGRETTVPGNPAPLGEIGARALSELLAVGNCGFHHGASHPRRRIGRGGAHRAHGTPSAAGESTVAIPWHEGHRENFRPPGSGRDVAPVASASFIGMRDARNGVVAWRSYSGCNKCNVCCTVSGGPVAWPKCNIYSSASPRSVRVTIPVAESSAT
jgi:hypothetical protein